MFRTILSHFTLPLLLLFGIISGNSQSPTADRGNDTGTLEKMIVASGSVAMDLDLNRLNGVATATTESKLETLRFEAGPNSFFTILVLNNALRGPEPGSMGLIRKNSAILPEALNASSNQLVVEKIDSSEPFDLVVRDGKTGFRFFNIEGHQYEYDAAAHLLRIKDGRLLMSEEFAKTLGRAADAGSTVGKISIAATMYPIEIDKLVNGAVQSAVLPALRAHGVGAEAAQPSVGTVPGPDVIVGDLPAVTQPTGASNGSYVGLGVGTTSCNQGVVDLDWFALPQVDHPVIPQNLFRMSGGATNTDRFEQIGQSWLKHAFTALTQNVCNLGCNGVGGTHLGSGCSDPYSSSLNASQSGLGSRAWVNPFTGAFPSTAANHSGHTHTGTSHRVLVAMSDLDTTQNADATYFAEGQYVTPHEYAWCQAHAGQCNMYNNVSYRQFSVTGTTSFAFSPLAATVRSKPAINAWTGATLNQIEPAPGVDGIGIVGYKVTNPSAGVWHYEYAVYNENLDRAIQSFSVPLGCGITVSNLGFHAPPQEPGWANDGTLNNAGYSGTPWASNQTPTNLAWSSETFAQNQNANALRWGTLYSFRFDSNRPPQAASATIGYFKTGSPTTVAIQGPMPDATCNPLQLTSAVSRKTHGGAGDFDIDLPLAGEPGVECRSSSGDHTFVVTFSNPVVSGNASVTSGSGTVAGSPTFSGNTMTVNLTGVADVQQITVTLSNVTDNTAQVLPDTPLSANMLIGDTNANKSVNAGDLAQTKAQSGVVVTGANFRTDINANGSVNAADTAIVKANAGHTLP
jgi:hypothetical protein